MRVSIAILLCLCVWFVGGCGKSEDPAPTGGSTGTVAASNPLVGTWKLESTGSDTGTISFTEDTFSLDFKMGERSENITGKYTRADKKITLTPETEGGKPSNEKPMDVTLSDDMKSFDMTGLGKMVKQ